MVGQKGRQQLCHQPSAFSKSKGEVSLIKPNMFAIEMTGACFSIVPKQPRCQTARPHLSGAPASHLASELIFLCQLPHKDFLSFSVWVWFALVVVLLSFGFVCVWFPVLWLLFVFGFFGRGGVRMRFSSSIINSFHVFLLSSPL